MATGVTPPTQGCWGVILRIFENHKQNMPQKINDPPTFPTVCEQLRERKLSSVENEARKSLLPAIAPPAPTLSL